VKRAGASCFRPEGVEDAMTVKMYGLIPPKPGMTIDEFHDYYRHPHGTMGRNMSTMRGYVQNHRIESDRLKANSGGFEAVAEIWLDNEADALNFRNEPILVQLSARGRAKVRRHARAQILCGAFGGCDVGAGVGHRSASRRRDVVGSHAPPQHQAAPVH
jgi:hypothetical protein